MVTNRSKIETIIEQALEKHHVSGDQFAIEITEKVALDDFGTGYLSLSYIKTLPIDILKIDQSFIDEMANNKSQEDFKRLIIQLEMTLIAEGVDSTEQLKLPHVNQGQI